MKIERHNGIVDKTNKLWTGFAFGMIGWRKQPLFIEILEDANGKTTLSVGNERNQIVVDVKDVEEVINAWKGDKK